IMIDLGKMAVASGIAIEAVKKSLMTLGPFAIPAGLALIAVGSAFASGAGKIGKSMGSGVSSGSSSYGSSVTNQDYSQFRGALYNNDKQAVELTIKGNNLVGAMKINQTRNTRLG